MAGYGKKAGKAGGYSVKVGLGGGVIISPANNKIDFIQDASTSVATIASSTYITGASFATAVQAALNTASLGAVFTCTFSGATKKLTTTSDATTYSLLFATGVNVATSARTAMGFNAADKTGALTYTSDNALPV